jgi:hypothetical protein
LTIPGSTSGTILYYQQDSAQRAYSNRYLILEPYIQDDWKVAPTLALNLGLRLSLFGNVRLPQLANFWIEPRSHQPLELP